MRTRLCFGLLVSAFGCQAVFAHSDLETRLLDVNRAITAHPGDYVLYLRRAEVKRQQHDWVGADVDLAEAEALAPADISDELDLRRGRLYEEAGEPARALAAINAYLIDYPKDIAALRIRALSFARLSLFDEAIADYGTMVSLEGARSPELWLERARLSVQAGNVDAALAGVDAAIESLGPLVVLIEFAVRTELDRGNYVGALARIDLLSDPIAASPRWLSKRGALLEALERPEEAAAAYSRAREAIDALPLRRRNAPAMRALYAQLSR